MTRWNKKELNEISDKEFAIRILKEQYEKLDPYNFKAQKLNSTIRWLEKSDEKPINEVYIVKERKSQTVWGSYIDEKLAQEFSDHLDGRIAKRPVVQCLSVQSKSVFHNEELEA